MLLFGSGCTFHNAFYERSRHHKAVLLASIVDIDQGRPEEVAKAHYASNADEQKILDSFVDQARCMHQLRQCVLQRFGATAASHFVCGIANVKEVEDDLGKMPVTIKAKTSIVDAGTETFHLIKIDGVWRVPISAMLKGPPKQTPAEIIKYSKENEAFLTKAISKLKAGEFKSVEEVSEHMKNMMYAHQ